MKSIQSLCSAALAACAVGCGTYSVHDQGMPSGGDLGVGAVADQGDVADLASGADLAAPIPGPLRVAAFNLHCLMDNPTTRLQGVAAEVKARNLDAIGLEEVCETLTGGGADNSALVVAQNLTALTGQDWDHTFVKTHLAWSNMFQEGVSVVAKKGQISDQGEHELPYQDGLRRVLGWAKVTTDRGAFQLYVTHLSISSNNQDRIDEVNEILKTVSPFVASGLPQVVVGDFNSTPDTQAIATMIAGPPAFTDSWAKMNPGQMGYTIDSTNPHARIDYIFVNSSALKALNKVEIAFNQQYMGVWMSDHFGIAAELVAN
jgi:endonuclease/exonuclease/phosphatase family metal-dependent hydrolase